MEVTVVDGSEYGTSVDQRHGALDPETMSALGVEPGDSVLVTGGNRTTVTAERLDGADAGRVLCLNATDRDNAGAEAGETVTVERVTPPVAERVSVLMSDDVPAGYDVRGATGVVERALGGAPVTTGDRISVSVLGGAITLGFTVEGTTPTGPVVVGSETELSVSEPAGTGGDADTAYADVGGLDDVLQTVRQYVELPLAAPDLVEQVGGAATSGVLLFGPSGTGKTLLASAVANEVDGAVVRVSPSSRFYDGTVDGEALVRAATDQAPAVVVIDDVDVLAPAESGSGDGRSAAELGAALDTLSSQRDVTVVATATDPDDVASSLRRGGRLGHEVELGTPDRDQRRAILDVHFRGVPLAGVDLDRLAARTRGFVGADIALLVSEATRAAIDRVTAGGTLGTDVDPDDVVVRAPDVETALDRVSPSGLRGLQIEQPAVSYEDIGGLESVKRELVRAVEWPLRYPELFEAVHDEAPSGVLLYGPPGTGKTMLARAVASSSDANFIAVNGPELFDRYVGESERGVRRVFERARENAPTVVFFDELDALGASRSADADAGATDRVVSQLLTELDGIEPTEDVVVIGATNRPELLDDALRRPGRLERELAVPLPDEAAREAIFEVHLSEVPVVDVDTAALASATEGYSGSDIAAVVRRAGMLAMEEYLRERGFDVDPSRVDEVRIRARHLNQALSDVTPSVDDSEFTRE